MSLYYITGVSGTGKSSVMEELRSRGYAAYGVDEDCFGMWIRHDNGTAEAFPENDPNFSIYSWYAEHAWVLNIEKVAGLSKKVKSDTQPTFLCGNADTENCPWRLFQQVFALHIDEDTLRERIQTRTNNDFGKHPDEMNDILLWHKRSEAYFKRNGAVDIDATQPVEKVSDQILAKIKKSTQK